MSLLPDVLRPKELTSCSISIIVGDSEERNTALLKYLILEENRGHERKRKENRVYRKGYYVSTSPPGDLPSDVCAVTDITANRLNEITNEARDEPMPTFIAYSDW